MNREISTSSLGMGLDPDEFLSFEPLIVSEETEEENDDE